MKLEKIDIGIIRIPDGKLDITDPCYDNDVWCRSTIDVKPGTYYTYAWKGKDKDFGIGIWILTMRIIDDVDEYPTIEKLNKNRNWKLLGDIGVDAGMAGFFNCKPNFSNEQWLDFCRNVEKHEYGLYEKDQGVWCITGSGDGTYDYYGIKNSKNEIVAVELRF